LCSSQAEEVQAEAEGIQAEEGSNVDGTGRYQNLPKRFENLLFMRLLVVGRTSELS
jgi:hypothetical protein